MLVPITYIQIVITDFDKNITVFLGQSTIGPRCERENILAVDIRGWGHNNSPAIHIILKKKGNNNDDDNDDDDDDEGSDRRSRMPTSISLWVTCSHKTSALQ